MTWLWFLYGFVQFRVFRGQKGLLWFRDFKVLGLWVCMVQWFFVLSIGFVVTVVTESRRFVGFKRSINTRSPHVAGDQGSAGI